MMCSLESTCFTFYFALPFTTQSTVQRIGERRKGRSTSFYINPKTGFPAMFPNQHIWGRTRALPVRPGLAAQVRLGGLRTQSSTKNGRPEDHASEITKAGRQNDTSGQKSFEPSILLCHACPAWHCLAAWGQLWPLVPLLKGPSES